MLNDTSNGTNERYNPTIEDLALFEQILNKKKLQRREKLVMYRKPFKSAHALLYYRNIHTWFQKK